MAFTKMDIYIIFIIFIKFIFILASLGHVYLIHVSKTPNPELDETFLYWKDRAEFIFTILMAILLIIVFNPHLKFDPKEIDTEMKLLMFLFGWILIVTAKWGHFFTETPWLQTFNETSASKKNKKQKKYE
jgi:hypothetical protein